LDVPFFSVISPKETTIRRLRPGDEEVVARLAEREPRTALLADERTIFVAAFDGEEPVGFAFGYLLPRRHGDAEVLFVYELEVAESHRRRGIATRLMRELIRLGGAPAFVLTEPDNVAANRTYAGLGGERVDSVMWDFAAP
jgi:ribosomal protein S18 acetylase RimI-like enzyme